MAGRERRKNEGAVAIRSHPAPGGGGKGSPTRSPADEEASPGLKEVKEFVRNLVVAEKSYLLYPVKGKVVQSSLDACMKCLVKVFEQSGPDLCLEVTQFELLYDGEPVYHDENTGKSLAYRLSKDSIRLVQLRSGTTPDELSGFLSCFKECKQFGDAEEEFSTAFWEKDLKHIQIDIAANFVEECAVDLPVPRGFSGGFDIGRFAIDEATEKRIEELLAGRRSGESRSCAFEITAEEQARLQLVIDAEKLYFPLYDFVDVILEVMLQEQNAKGFQWALKLIRTAVFALIENLDFEHACGLLEKLCGGKRQGLTSAHQLHLKEMVKGLGDKATMDVLQRFLAENPSLPHDHDVFRLMRLIGPEAVPRFCELLTLPAHIPAITTLLVQLGKDYGELFARYLLDPDPQVVRAMIQVLLKTDREHAVERVAVALGHADEGTRALAAKTIAEARDPRAGPYLIRLLTGQSRQLMLLAIQHFAAAPCPGAYEPILAVINAAAFHGLDAARQDLCFKALRLAEPEQSEAFICGQVLRWRPSLGQKSRKRKAAALRALALGPTDRALSVLRRFAASKRGELGHVARQALAAQTRKVNQVATAEVSSV